MPSPVTRAEFNTLAAGAARAQAAGCWEGIAGGRPCKLHKWQQWLDQEATWAVLGKPALMRVPCHITRLVVQQPGDIHLK